jgi:2-methylcitrate dehydratase PrpD
MSSSATGPTSRTDAIHALVCNVVNTRFEDLSQKAVDATKTFILDCFGVAIAGSLAPRVSETLAVLGDW